MNSQLMPTYSYSKFNSLILGLLIGASALVVSSPFAFAGSASILNLNDQDFESLSQELSSNFMYRSVLGAAPLGSVFGAEVGIIGGSQASTTLDKLSKDSGSSGVSSIYHAGIVAAVSVPFGITIEGVIFPKTTLSDLEISTTNLAAKWSLNTEVLKVIPFNLALRGFTGNSKMSFSQTIPSVGTAKIETEMKSSGFQILASPVLPFIEPYAGVGAVSATTNIGSSQGSIFSDGSTSKEKSLNSTQVILGVNANILVFHLGAEYTSAFNQSAYTLKLGFGF